MFQLCGLLTMSCVVCVPGAWPGPGSARSLPGTLKALRGICVPLMELKADRVQQAGPICLQQLRQCIYLVGGNPLVWET